MTDQNAVVPVTGEVVDLSNAGEVARALADVESLGRAVAEAKRVLNDALVRYSQEVAVSRTFEIPGQGKWVREGGPKTEYVDPAALKRALLDAGMPAERVAEIVVETIDRKVNGAEANKAARSNPRFAEVIDRHRRKVEAPYRMTRKG